MKLLFFLSFLINCHNLRITSYGLFIRRPLWFLILSPAPVLWHLTVTSICGVTQLYSSVLLQCGLLQPLSSSAQSQLQGTKPLQPQTVTFSRKQTNIVPLFSVSNLDLSLLQNYKSSFQTYSWRQKDLMKYLHIWISVDLNALQLLILTTYFNILQLPNNTVSVLSSVVLLLYICTVPYMWDFLHYPFPSHSVIFLQLSPFIFLFHWPAQPQLFFIFQQCIFLFFLN